MREIYTDEYAFARAVRFADAQIRQWCIQTGRQDKRTGAISYKAEDIPAEIDAPSNDDRSRAEVILFRMQPLAHGASYGAYLSHMKPEHEAQAYQLLGTPKVPHGIIATFTGEPLAFVTRITSYNAVCFGRDAGMKGSFWAIGIDGRQYYGRHNGRGMFCRMRLAKWRDEFDVEQQTCAGWEIVSSASTRRVAAANATDYRNNQPELAVRIVHRKVRQ